MSTLSYCAFENTNQDLQVCMAKLLAGDVADWSDSEIRAVKRLFDYADSIMECREEIEARLEELEEEEEDEGDNHLCDGGRECEAMGCYIPEDVDSLEDRGIERPNYAS